MAGLRTDKPWEMFVFAGVAACCAETCTNPLDMIKVRIQIQNRMQSTLGSQIIYKNSLDAGIKIIRNEGWRTLYAGLPPALIRQATYGALRYGIYNQLKIIIERLRGKGKEHSFFIKMACGCGAGAIASSIANPTDLLKIRLQGSFARASITGERPRYTNVWDAFKSIYRNENGIRAFYKGVGPCATRAALVAGSGMAVYDHLKALLITNNLMQDGKLLHFVSSLCSGLISCFISSPADVIKTRVMNQQVDKFGTGISYKGSFDCLVKTVKYEGLRALWKGFWPNYLRFGPNVIITFLILEQQIYWWNSFKQNKNF